MLPRERSSRPCARYGCKRDTVAEVADGDRWSPVCEEHQAEAWEAGRLIRKAQNPLTTTPVMALRPDHEDPELMDDIVVENVATFRAEDMGDSWWVQCRFANGDDVTFSVRALCRPRRIEWTVTNMPTRWIDWDERRREQTGQPS